MALIMFSCQATAPFIMFRDTAQRVFKEIGRTLTQQGAFSSEELPGILAKLDEAQKRDKALIAEREAAAERRRRECSYDEELREKEEDNVRAKEKDETVFFYQRIVPLQEMIRRAIKHDKAIVWGQP